MKTIKTKYSNSNTLGEKYNGLKEYKCIIHETHANNRGIVTLFIYTPGTCTNDSYNINDYNTTKEFLNDKYPNIKI